VWGVGRVSTKHEFIGYWKVRVKATVSALCVYAVGICILPSVIYSSSCCEEIFRVS